MTCIYGCSNKVTHLKCYAWNLFLKLDIYGTLTIANKKWSYGEIIFCCDHVESISMFSKKILTHTIFLIPPFAQDFQYQKIKSCLYTSFIFCWLAVTTRMCSFVTCLLKRYVLKECQSSILRSSLVNDE